MNNNDILRRISQTFSFSHEQIVGLFAQADQSVTAEQVSHWLEREGDSTFESLADASLAMFLNGLIVHNRGKLDGPPRLAEESLNNNIVLRKLKIALDFKNDDVLRLMALAGSPVKKPELTAFFRKIGHKHYRECQDEVLNSFFEGMHAEFHSEGE